MASFLAIVRDRKLELLDPAGWRAELQKHVGRQVAVTIKGGDTRSLQANAYWWGVVVEFFRGVWSQQYRPGGIPYTPEQTHEILVELILGFEDGPRGARVRRRTRDLTPAHFSALIDTAKQIAWQDYRSRIPEPGEPVDGL